MKLTHSLKPSVTTPTSLNRFYLTVIATTAKIVQGLLCARSSSENIPYIISINKKWKTKLSIDDCLQ